MGFLAGKLATGFLGITGGGGQAEYLVVPQPHLARIPQNLDFIAAAMPDSNRSLGKVVLDLSV